MDMIKTLRDNPDILANMLELWDYETGGMLDCNYYRNMTQFKKTFDYTEEELSDYLGNGFNFNHKYFYTYNGYIFSSDEKDYTPLILDDPFLFKAFLEWLSA